MQVRIKLGVAVAFALLSAGVVFGADAPVTFTAFTYDPVGNWANMNDEIGKVITAKTGVVINLEQAVGNADQKIALIAASGQLPDLISPKAKSAELIDSGYLLDLTDLIDKYAPNIKKMLGDQMVRLRYSSKDKAIYFVPSYSTLGGVSYDTDAWYKLQLGALKEQGYPKVKTLKDYEKVIADYVKKHPKTADGQPTIGLSLLTDDWRYVITVTNPAFWATGAPDDGEFSIDPKTYAAKEHYFRADEREYFRWLNHMNDIGLLDRETFTQKYDQYKAKIATGRVVGLIDAQWEIGDATNALKASGKLDQMYGRFPAVLKDGMKAAYNMSVGFDGGWGYAITKSCKDPVKAIKFLDYLASDEGQVLINWGIEGKDWKMVNGKRTLTEDAQKARKADMNAYTKTVGVGNYNMSLRYGDGAKDAKGNYYTTNDPTSILENYSANEKAALKAYGVTYWGDLLPKATDFPVKPWGAAWNIPVPDDSVVKQHWDVEQNIVRKRVTEMILAKPADFDKLYDAFLAELGKATGHMAAAESQLITDRLKLWGVLK